MPRESEYQFIDSHELPMSVFDELCDNMNSDGGKIFNPEYHPKFKKWLEQMGYEVKPYIIWDS